MLVSSRVVCASPEGDTELTFLLRAAVAEVCEFAEAENRTRAEKTNQAICTYCYVSVVLPGTLDSPEAGVTQ